MSFVDTLSKWGQELVKDIQRFDAWVVSSIHYLDSVAKYAPEVVTFIMSMVQGLLGLTTSGVITGAQAQSVTLAAAQSTFTGSGPVLPEPVLRALIEHALIVAQAKQGKTDPNIAVSMAKGFVKQTEFEAIGAAMPLKPV